MKGEGCLLPVEIDVVCGIKDNRDTWHYERMVHVADPHEFVGAVRDFVAGYLAAQRVEIPDRVTVTHQDVVEARVMDPLVRPQDVVTDGKEPPRGRPSRDEPETAEEELDRLERAAVRREQRLTARLKARGAA